MGKIAGGGVQSRLQCLSACFAGTMAAAQSATPSFAAKARSVGEGQIAAAEVKVERVAKTDEQKEAEAKRRRDVEEAVRKWLNRRRR